MEPAGLAALSSNAALVSALRSSNELCWALFLHIQPRLKPPPLHQAAVSFLCLDDGAVAIASPTEDAHFLLLRLDNGEAAGSRA